MTPTEQEDDKIAQEAYTIWCGSQRTGLRPVYWNELSNAWQDCFRFVVAHARHHELAALIPKR